MKNITAILVCLMVSASMVHAGVTSGRKPMVSRQSMDIYSVIGEGTVKTVGCTIKAESMQAIVEWYHNKMWITFLDNDGEIETSCEIVTRHVTKPAK